jgi:hypothetical protein
LSKFSELVLGLDTSIIIGQLVPKNFFRKIWKISDSSFLKNKDAFTHPNLKNDEKFVVFVLI